METRSSNKNIYTSIVKDSHEVGDVCGGRFANTVIETELLNVEKQTLDKENTEISHSKCFTFVNNKMKCLTFYAIIIVIFLQLVTVCVEKLHDENYNRLTDNIGRMIKKGFNKFAPRGKNICFPNETALNQHCHDLFANNIINVNDSMDVNDLQNTSNLSSDTINEYDE